MTASRTLNSWLPVVALLCLVSQPRAAEGGREKFNLEEFTKTTGCTEAAMTSAECIAALKVRAPFDQPSTSASGSPSPDNQPPSLLPTQPPTQPPAQSATQPPAQSATQPPAQSATQPPAQSATQPPAQSATQPPAQSATQPPAQSATQPPAQAATQPPAQSATQPPTQPQVPLNSLPRGLQLGRLPTRRPRPVPVVSAPTPGVGLPPGLTGLSTGSIDGFVLVMVFGDGTKCVSNVDSHVSANVRHFGADTYLEAFGTLEGVGQCRPGARGLGLALLTSEAFAKVIKKGEDCKTTAESRTQLNSNIIGTGLSIGVSGGFGVEGGCHRRKNL